MTAADPGASATPGTETRPNGAASGGGTPAAGGKEYSYLQQVEAGGDFAKREVVSHQSRADRAEARFTQLVEKLGGEDGDLMGLLRLADGKAISQFVQRYATLRNNPATAELIQRFEQSGDPTAIASRKASGSSNGSVAAEDDLDEYDPAAKRIRALEGRFQQLEQSLGGLSASTGQAALQKHLEKFRDSNFMEDEEFGKLAGWFRQYVGDLDPRDPATVRVLNGLNSPNGYETVATLALGHLHKSNPEFFFGLGERKRLHDQRRVSRFETDVPSGLGTVGGELPAEVKKMNAQQVLDYFASRAERGD